MTNARQIKHLFSRLVERHEDVVQIGPRLLWLKPIHHIGLRVFVERTSDADCASIRWTMLELFLPRQNVQYAVGHDNHLWRSKTDKEKDWQWSDASMIDDAVSIIEDEALPALRRMRKFEFYAEYYYALYNRSYFQRAEDCMIVDVAMGNLESARNRCEELLPIYRVNKHPDWMLWQTFRTQVVMIAEPLRTGDRQALARILQGWEAANVRGTSVERYWEPTPFPLERLSIVR